MLRVTVHCCTTQYHHQDRPPVASLSIGCADSGAVDRCALSRAIQNGVPITVFLLVSEFSSSPATPKSASLVAMVIFGEDSTHHTHASLLGGLQP